MITLQLTSDGLCFRVSDFNQLQNLIVKTAPIGWTIPELSDISDGEEQEYTDEYENDSQYDEEEVSLICKSS